ncbi:hypothetical protein ACIRCZ_19785 [Leifsonia sp. NPDC102414]|uniref:hypothetical protein n=1 Tax=Leifsonia sp. NPDC102414 TaxID=3364124 RepID=UPI00381E5730
MGHRKRFGAAAPNTTHKKTILRKGVAGILGLTIAGLSLLGTAGASEASAAALKPQTPDVLASEGLGIAGATKFGGYAGSYTAPGGVDAYCADPGRSWPSGNTGAGYTITSFTSDTGNVLSGAAMSGVNGAYAAYGHGTAVDRAAFDFLIYAYTGSNLGGGVQPGTEAEGLAYISSSHPEITAKFQEVWAYAQANQNVGGGGTDTGSYTFNVNNNNYTGTMTAHIGATGGVATTTTLTNGIFVATGTNTITGLTNGQQVAVKGVPPANATSYEISATGSVQVSGSAAAELEQFDTGSQQRLLAGTATTRTHNYPISGRDPFMRTTLFAPVLTTQVSTKIVKAGDKPTDTITFATAPFTYNGHTVDNPWVKRLSGLYREVEADGTLYGPSASPFVPGVVPPGTLVAGHANLLTSSAKGPTVPYEARSDTAVRESGYYNWVWSIKYANQTADNTQLFIPADYSFVDEFGQVPETSVVPSDVEVTTSLTPSADQSRAAHLVQRLDSQEVALGGEVSDLLTPSVHGGAWLQADGTRIPVTFTGRAYYTPNEPVQSKTLPKDAVLLDTVQATVPDLDPVTAPPVNVGWKAGYVSMQWSIEKAAQPPQYQGDIAPWSDDFGISNETVKIVGPTVTSKALASTGPGGTTYDTAIVAGPIPVDGVDLTFRGYLQKPGAQPLCDASTLLYSSATPVHATTDGQYPSGTFTTDPRTPVGSAINWVITASLHDTGTVFSQGACGDKSEQTRIAPPSVTSTPPATLMEGQAGHDTLHVTGWIPAGTTTTVTLYKQSDGANQLVCDASTKVQILAAVSLAAGRATNQVDTTKDTGALPAGRYGFVHVTRDSIGRVIATGNCHDEQFVVSPNLAHTGSDTALDWALGGGAAFLLIAGITIALIARRRNRVA